MSIKERVLKLYSPGKVLKTKASLKFFSSVDMGSRTQSRGPGIYIIKRSEISTNPKRICITLNDDWVLKFTLDDFVSTGGMEPRINEYIEILGN